MNIKQTFTTSDGKNQLITFLLITCLFLVLGFSTGLIDVLNKHFQNALQITKAESGLVQFSNYIAYFIFAIPAGIVAEKLSYKKGICIGLVLIAIGAFSFMLALEFNTFSAFLCSLFVLAIGLTFMETTANPYATLLGNPKGNAARLNIAQSVTGIGLIFGPLIGGYILLSDTGKTVATNDKLLIPYLGIGVVVLILACIIGLKKMPNFSESISTKDNEFNKENLKILWHKPHFIFAVVSQFLYLAAQTGIFSFFINYTVEHSPILTNFFTNVLPNSWYYMSDKGYVFSEVGASQLLAFGGFGLFMIGRFTGGLLSGKYKPANLLAIFSVTDAILMLIIMTTSNGYLGVIALILSFYFMSIMYPTIFALGIFGLGNLTKKASSFIVMAIVGGAIMPIIMGKIADVWSMNVGFIVPLICFLIIGLYGYK